MLKPIVVIFVCAVIGYLWSRSHRNRRMLPIALAFLPALDAWLVQSQAVQAYWATHLQGMTASAGGCQVGLGDFAIGGLVIGAVSGSGIGALGILATTVLVGIFSWVGIRVALDNPGTLVPETIFPALAGVPAFLGQWRSHWMAKPPTTVKDGEKNFSNEVIMIRVLCPLCGIAALAGWISLIIHS